MMAGVASDGDAISILVAAIEAEHDYRPYLLATF